MESSNQDRIKMNAVYNLMRRLPPNQVTKSLAGVSALIKDGELMGRIFEAVDQPLCK